MALAGSVPDIRVYGWIWCHQWRRKTLRARTVRLKARVISRSRSDPSGGDIPTWRAKLVEVDAVARHATVVEVQQVHAV